jgi:hypothetical protein
MKIRELLRICEDGNFSPRKGPEVDRAAQADARKRAEWHKAQAKKYNDEDEESKLAKEAHLEAEFGFIRVSQEYMYGNNRVAQNLTAQIEKALKDKSALAAKDIAQ